MTVGWQRSCRVSRGSVPSASPHAEGRLGYTLHPARALRVDLHHLVADHIDADEVHAVGHELLAHRFDDAAFRFTDLERDRASARADVGPRVVTRGHSPEGGQLPVALEDLSLEQEDPGIAVLTAV